VYKIMKNRQLSALTRLELPIILINLQFPLFLLYVQAWSWKHVSNTLYLRVSDVVYQRFKATVCTTVVVISVVTDPHSSQVLICQHTEVPCLR